ncbi:MAG TPA: (d)CMP kinase [Lachnospiraceae bacterium]
MNIIAIDGPAGAGKSTIARQVAKKLGYIYVDTGAMYRAMALHILNAQCDLENEEEIEKLVDSGNIEIIYKDGQELVILNNSNVSDVIRREEVGNTASKIAARECVRKKLVDLQREMAKKTSVVMDGRDIGTEVLPDANVKVYLTASVDTRAQRRYKELQEKGLVCDLDQIKKDIEQRDYQDMNRKISPLRQAEDAYLLDSSNLTIEEVVDVIMGLVRK